MNAERAAGRARYPKGVNWFKKKMDRDLKAASSQARKRVGPPIKESGLKLDRSNWGLPRIIK